MQLLYDLQDYQNTNSGLRFILGDCFEHGVAIVGFDIDSNKDKNELKGKEGGLDSAEKCQKMCQITADCELFTYIVNKKECLLKKFDALLAWQIERKEGHISGSKFCNYGGYWIVVF